MQKRCGFCVSSKGGVASVPASNGSVAFLSLCKGGAASVSL